MVRFLQFSLRRLFLTTIILTISASQLRAQKPPIIPVGLDAYRMWDQWPDQRIGVRAYMRSTYDRIGGNEFADASHFLFMNEEDYNVTLDVKGKGILYFFRANHWHGSPWNFIVDERSNIVEETGTSDPLKAMKLFKESKFNPESTFPRPLNWTWEVTKGADLIWTPMPFEQSMRIAYSRTCYGTGYYIYHLFADESELSHPIKTFDLNSSPDQDILDLFSEAGKDIAPLDISKKAGQKILDQECVLIETIQAETPQQIRAMKFAIPLENALELERIRLVATWDDAKYPSIDSPLCMFFGAGTFYNREEKEYLVKGLPVNIRYDYTNRKIELGCYFPMPFFKSARFELKGIKPQNGAVDFEIRYEPLKVDPQFSSYFHATYKDIPEPEMGRDMIYLDTKGSEGHDEWSGSFIGNCFIFSHNGVLNTLEGDPRFFFDDSNSPQAYGTGTEEWGGGGDYWGGLNMTLPLAGHPCGALNKEAAKHEKDIIESAYRFLLADLFPFGKRAVIQFEHGGENLSKEHYECVSYWYGLPKPSLIKTDEFDVGNISSEKHHDYYSPEASEVEKLTSRYELGIDAFPGRVENSGGVNQKKIQDYEKLIGKEIYPEQEMDGRHTRGTTEFTVKVHPNNHGLLLRRTLDYSFPNQTAEVFVSDVASAKKGKWQRVGIWYLAGSKSCMASHPDGELDLRILKVQTSNRRLRDDEFMIPAKLTEGNDHIRLKIRFIDNVQQLAPGIPFPNQSAWSELGYQVYSIVIPSFKVE